MNPLAERLLQLAGSVTWLAIGVPPLVVVIQDGPERLLDPGWALFALAYLLFGYLFLANGTRWSIPALDRRPQLLLAALVVSAATAMLALPSYLTSAILFIITASFAAHVIGQRWGVLLVALQSGVVLAAALATFDGLTGVVVQTVIYAGFQLFALITTQVSLNEARARRELAQVNAELRATQALLADSSRMAERLRISRELHDLIGHHLTALALNLEVASHKSEGEVKGHVDTARSVAKLLLSDVRDAVSTLRDEASIDVAGALRELVEAVPQPAIHLDLPADLHLADPGTAQVLIRCVQEAITNAVRHAQADNLWIVIGRGDGGLTIDARDDGRGAERLAPGNGLLGMRERLEAVGGALDIEADPGRGFRLSARLPA